MTQTQSPLGAMQSPPLDQPPFPPTILKGQTAFVTGGGSGMGFGMARAFAQAGANVAIVGRSLERLEGVLDQLTCYGVEAAAVPCDVRDAQSVQQAFNLAEQQLGDVSIVANNAGGNFPAIAEAMSPNAWRAIIRIAVDGTFLCSTELARRCKQRGIKAAIVNNSAQYVWSGFPGDAHSAAAKSAIVHMTKSMAADWKADGIRVNCVAAGFFPHDDAVGAELADNGLERMAKMFPIGRVGDRREWGWLATFMVSPLAQGITGETVIIDGGDRLRRELMSPAFVPPRERSSVWGELPQ